MENTLLVVVVIVLVVIMGAGVVFWLRRAANRGITVNGVEPLGRPDETPHAAPHPPDQASRPSSRLLPPAKTGAAEPESEKEVEPAQSARRRSFGPRADVDDMKPRDEPAAAEPSPTPAGRPAAAPHVQPSPQPAMPPSPTPEAAPPVGGTALTVAARFTGFAPREAAVETWYTLLVYAHVDEALARVRADAQRFRYEMGDSPREARSSPPVELARGTEITIVPTCEEVTFNPERQTLRWTEDMHRVDFRLRAEASMLDLASNLTVTVYAGPLIVSVLKMGILFVAAESVTPVPDKQEVQARLYASSEIFPSYSHRDEEIVLACRNAYKALGYEFLRDKDTLRPGEAWNTRLMELIEQADIFQLFWSARSAASPYCRQEWEYALKLRDEGRKSADFIRPVYWERDGFVTPPPELGALHFAYVELPRSTAAPTPGAH